MLSSFLVCPAFVKPSLIGLFVLALVSWQMFLDLPLQGFDVHFSEIGHLLLMAVKCLPLGEFL